MAAKPNVSLISNVVYVAVVRANPDAFDCYDSPSGFKKVKQNIAMALCDLGMNGKLTDPSDDLVADVLKLVEYVSDRMGDGLGADEAEDELGLAVEPK